MLDKSLIRLAVQDVSFFSPFCDFSPAAAATPTHYHVFRMSRDNPSSLVVA